MNDPTSLNSQEYHNHAQMSAQAALLPSANAVQRQGVQLGCPPARGMVLLTEMGPDPWINSAASLHKGFEIG